MSGLNPKINFEKRSAVVDLPLFTFPLDNEDRKQLLNEIINKTELNVDVNQGLAHVSMSFDFGPHLSSGVWEMYDNSFIKHMDEPSLSAEWKNICLAVIIDSINELLPKTMEYVQDRAKKMISGTKNEENKED